ncbi:MULTISPECIES: AzlC family ABC transporter permease [Halorussus]|uniref:AzlC family ABC transporter permease n=1 Tax=Halorussus TaxID=1070314 RepID=UPI000E219198|nr:MULTISPECIES: AzlC family ABC transporter permease [Halorussus]NHN60983.1 branched-chain amino acid ABC transporter permease [Halorussus sp. JP-T4]
MSGSATGSGEPRAAFRAGVRDVLPALPANVPFGIIAGVATVGAGFDPAQATAFAGMLFAGAAQVAAVELVDQRAPVVVVVATALVVNLRYLMYSASLGAHFRDLSTRWKLVVAFFLLDVTYALSVGRFEGREDADPTGEGRWYYLGTALPLWGTWIAASLVGIVFGARVPAGWQLDFAIPLLFMGLLFPALDGGPSYVAAGAAGVLAVAGFGLPFNVGILAAAVGGILAGVLAEVSLR